MATPKNKVLYNKIKEEAKQKYKRYPSIYANSWIVNEYKKRGGEYIGSKPKQSGLKRWYKEEWVDLNNPIKKNGKIVGYHHCGRKTSSLKKEKYPLCRPSRVVNSKTPRTHKEISKKSISKAKKEKSKLKHRGTIQFGSGFIVDQLMKHKDDLIKAAIKEGKKQLVKELENLDQEKLMAMGKKELEKYQDQLLEQAEAKLKEEIKGYLSKNKTGGWGKPKKTQRGSGFIMNQLNAHKDSIMKMAIRELEKEKGGQLSKAESDMFKKALFNELDGNLESKINFYIDNNKLGGGIIDDFKEFSSKKMKELSEATKKIKSNLSKQKEIHSSNIKNLMNGLPPKSRTPGVQQMPRMPQMPGMPRMPGMPGMEQMLLREEPLPDYSEFPEPYENQDNNENQVGGTMCGAECMIGGKKQYYGKRSSVMVKVPSNVQKWAAYAFKLKDMGFKGAQETGWKRARQLATQETIPIEDVRYMHAWFNRHIYTSYPGFKEWIKEGRPKTKEWQNKRSIIAIVTWGGPAALKWLNSKKILDLLENQYGKKYTKIIKRN